MNITIHSRRSIEKLLRTGLPREVAVISFCDDPSTAVHYGRQAARLYQTVVPDIQYEDMSTCGLNYATYFPDAEAVAAFVYEAVEADMDIICQSEHGISRAAGCAAALEQYFRQDGIFIFADHRYLPNKMVFHKLYDALWFHEHGQIGTTTK